jgi:hypothetical protein
MEDQFQMYSVRLPKLLPLQELRGANCSTEPAYKLEGEDGGHTQNIFERLITTKILIRRCVVAILKAP